MTNGTAFFGNAGAGAALCTNWFNLTGTVAGSTGGTSYQFYGVTDNADFALAAVPEPATLSLMGIGILGAARLSRRRRARA